MVEFTRICLLQWSQRALMLLCFSGHCGCMTGSGAGQHALFMLLHFGKCCWRCAGVP